MDAQSKFISDQPVKRQGEPLADPQNPQEERERALAMESTFHGATLPNEEDVQSGAPGCMRCEVLPMPIEGPGNVFLELPHTYTHGKILEFLAGSRYRHSEQNGNLCIEVGPGNSLAPLMNQLLERMSFTEQRDARARFQKTPAPGALPQVTEFSEIADLPTFAAHVRSTWLLDILREKRLYSVFQPIVRCRESGAASSSPDSIFGYECLMRAELNGTMVSPGDMMDIARAAGLLFQLDLAARRSSLVGAAQHGIAEKIFINFTPNAIYNPVSCLDSTLRLIDELHLRHDQIVFEIIESEQLPDMNLVRRIVGFYRDNGFGVALDDVGSGFSSLSLLVDLKPDFVKVDRSLLHGVDADAGRALVARKLLEVAQELGITTVAEGIETEEELRWAREHGADMAQGYLFARPSAPPPLRPNGAKAAIK